MRLVEESQPGARSIGSWKLTDWDRTLAVVDTWEQLEHAIASVRQTALTPNTIVDLTSPRGDTLSIGVAGAGDGDNPGLPAPLACLNFAPASREPPYLMVIGDPTLSPENGGVVVYRYEEGTWTEILRRNCVPLDVMQKIARHFFETGALPDWVSWEPV